MKLLIILSVFIIYAAANKRNEEPKENKREKRGFLAVPIPISYSSQYFHYTPSVAVSYHAPVAKYIVPVTAVKVFQSIPMHRIRVQHLTKVFTPVVSYTKIPYTSILPYHGYAHGYEHNFGHFLDRKI